MQDIRFGIIDPDITDEIYKPLRFFWRRRRALGKYSYLRDSNRARLFFTTHQSGIVKKKVLKTLPSILVKFIRNLEIFVWHKANKIKISCDFFNHEKKIDFILVTLRNCDESYTPLLNSYRDFGIKVIWLTSHLHLCIDKLHLIDSRDVVSCSAGSPLSRQQKYYKISQVLLPGVIHRRFQNFTPIAERSTAGILCVGTVHKYRNFRGGLIKHRDYWTIHPGRLNILMSKSKIFIKCLSVVSDRDSLHKIQKRYMSIDIVQKYNKYRYAYIGSEYLNIPALGVFEAMSCGCEIFIEQSIGAEIGLKDGATAWFFNGSSEDLEARFYDVISSGIELDRSQIESYLSAYQNLCSITHIKDSILEIDSCQAE